MALDLLALAKPLEPITLRDGSTVQPRPLDAEGWELYRRATSTGSDADAYTLLRWILPDITDAQLETIGITDTVAIVALAADKISLALRAVGNSPGTGAASTTPPSSPSPTPSTS